MSTAAIDREWRRFTPSQRLARFALYFGLVFACMISLRTVQIIPEFLYDAPEQMADLLKRMWPIEWSYYPKGVHEALLETLHIATLGTILAVLMALPLALLAAHNITPSVPLNYLAKLPVNTLKIDRSFVIDMTTSPEGLALVSTIIKLAHSLKRKVVAEGVETEEQARLLRLLACDEMQGYLFSKPVAAEIFEARFLALPVTG